MTQQIKAGNVCKTKKIALSRSKLLEKYFKTKIKKVKGGYAVYTAKK